VSVTVPSSVDWWNRDLPTAVPAISTSAAAGTLGVDDLVDNGDAMLRRLHLLTQDRFGAPADTAATFLMIWTMGAVANAVGATWALADAGLLVDPATLRFVPGDDVPIAGVQLGAVTTLVDPEHPWAGEVGSQVVADSDERRAGVVAGLVAAAEPIVEAMRRCTRVGQAGLWNQVGDGLVDWLTYRTDPPVTDPIVDAVHELVTDPARRWKATATAWTIARPAAPAFAVQKGGCCLEYRYARADDFTGDDGAAYLDEFPLRNGERITCNTCCLRDLDDAEARQRFWIDRRGRT
jgi:hypothetical protein